MMMMCQCVNWGKVVSMALLIRVDMEKHIGDTDKKETNYYLVMEGFFNKTPNSYSV